MIEKEILGCILKDNSLINETIIKANHFSNQAYSLLFQSMQQLAHEGKAIDKVTLLTLNYQYIQQLGGPSFITELEATGSVDNFESYERQFIEQYKQRESERITKEWISRKEKNINNLVNDLQQLEEFGLAEELDKNDILKEMINLPYLENVEDVGVPSGLRDLDALTGGFQNQNSYILGARPSMGKTATMLKFMLSAAQSGAVPIVFSLEMSKESLIRRLIATVGEINLFNTRNPHKLMDSKKKSWQAAIDELYKLDFEIYDEALQTIQHIRARVRKSQRKYEGKQIIVLIDYLTLIHSDKTYQSDHSKFTDISANLKAIAKDYNCPVITLAQLSRSVEQRQDKRPMLSDLRESGSIEQDADMVMFLYRESYYNKDSTSNTLEIIVAKHRDGPTGTAEVYYQKETGKMGDLSDYQSSVRTSTRT